MTITELAKIVHLNAVAHGWWDDDRAVEEIIALIHSEWSEALEECRAGRPMVWYACGESNNSTIPCNPKDDSECRMYGREIECQFRGKKPEGVAVELIDGIIRILDYFGKIALNAKDKSGNEIEFESIYSEDNVKKAQETPLPKMIAYLHMYTSSAIMVKNLGMPNTYALIRAVTAAASWVKGQGIDPLALLLEKHEYNKTRPYKHGKKF